MLESGTAPRGALRVGGVSVALEQLVLVLAMRCERIFCLAGRMTPEIAALQHEAERAGARFQLIPGPRGLLGQVTATDEVIALADGLFASVGDAVALLEPGPTVLVQPAESGVEAGFERIDPSLASGGALRIPGRLVERLADLPHDCDAFSALLRIALQAGIAQRPLPPAGQGDGFWTLLANEEQAHALEPLWIRRRIRHVRPFSPTRGLARLLVRSFGPALLHAGSGSRFVISGAVVLLALALGIGSLGWPGPALGAVALAWLLGEATAVLRRIEADRVVPPGRNLSLRSLFDWSVDALLVTLIAWSVPAGPWLGPLDRLFPPLMLLALLRIVPRVLSQAWTAWLEDRALLAILIGLGLLAGAGAPMVYGLAIALAACGILWPQGAGRLTPS
ncbi:hypothetical protein [Novosphingobium ginsenosidimutans]|uniref:Uncharacterized protein n=1 Tax=Novosphingobium ginsenosidimutans TaxID=1176536 RepID=A0A5B8S6E1_9SPHN|nr:hypothetical protein [Novosphingobium ginsenosidimutans]QEA16754.1 hypothetical protein FRF71_11775 [Novosphingobium ginsenosidimutans]